MNAKRQLHLNINILHSGFSPAAWRMEGSDPRASFDINHYVNVALVAERGTFDAIFLADQAAISDRVDFRPLTSLEPTIVLATVAAHTDRIGLIATASTTYNEPYNIARRFATLDHASGGRVGWNIVTSADLSQSRNFGLEKPVAHGSRYERASEFTTVVKALWDSWEEEAFLGDVATGRFVDPTRVHAIAHRGKHFSVHGPHNIPRPPQGHPVLVQAGGSDDGRQLAAEHAEAVFSASQSFEEALDYAGDLRARAARFGRAPDSLLVLAGLATIIGSTEAEAKRRQEELRELIPLEYSLARLSGVLQIDPKRLTLDEPLPDDIPLPPDGGHTFFQATLALARRDQLTVRGLIRALNGGTGHRTIIGTPQAVADDIETWFRSGAADGFNLMPDVLPHGLEVFVDEVVPILRRRGLFRQDYAGRTLRDHLGLARPANPYAIAAAE
ncbi:LLM class flavin-dependent oxidoreductase [Agrobacterium rhizogenes]|uniref:LLM class flavin-dependent oxidoreductase n=1 Tax=Rhizobium rhizogenes TaxID=359 RepID=UPI0006483AF4|nr:LLM class flavin-dependent oxidoreductase [Rhizobium rhizogenes]NTG76057.1 LLM class flavin-dependent oxidoreductase [Rhizobium rhizogenes]NTG88815.1 LLM class flavin-dependent oxidoreductase [Rhizobium rhizogenes]